MTSYELHNVQPEGQPILTITRTSEHDETEQFGVYPGSAPDSVVLVGSDNHRLCEVSLNDISFGEAEIVLAVEDSEIFEKSELARYTVDALMMSDNVRLVSLDLEKGIDLPKTAEVKRDRFAKDIGFAAIRNPFSESPTYQHQLKMAA